MYRQDAINRIKEIQSGNGDNFALFPQELKGRIAVSIESGRNPEFTGHDTTFNYDFEYGEIWGLIKAFNLGIEDLI